MGLEKCYKNTQSSLGDCSWWEFIHSKNTQGQSDNVANPGICNAATK